MQYNGKSYSFGEIWCEKPINGFSRHCQLLGACKQATKIAEKDENINTIKLKLIPGLLLTQASSGFWFPKVFCQHITELKV